MEKTDYLGVRSPSGFRILLLFLVTIAILLFLLRCSFGIAANPTQVEEPAPDFALFDLDNRQLTLRDYDGQVMLLNYWSLGCGACIEELPTLERLSKEHGSEEFVVVAVNVGDEAEDVEKFVNKEGYTFTVLLDPDMETSIRVVPTTYVVDRQNMLRLRWIGGPLTYQAILTELEAYLEETP
jgi:peroxiredoxin